jgi:hypothetical protein
VDCYVFGDLSESAKVRANGGWQVLAAWTAVLVNLHPVKAALTESAA